MGKVRTQVTAWSGHTACSGHTGGLGTDRDIQVTDSDLGHGVCVHMSLGEQLDNRDCNAFFGRGALIFRKQN